MIHSLQDRQNLSQTKGLKKSYTQYQTLIDELNDRAVPADLMETINAEVVELNEYTATDKSLHKLLKKSYRRVLKLLTSEINLVPKNYYRNQWMALGMTIFGLPIGMGIATAIGNFAMFGAFLPVGMAIGIAVGSGMDKKAKLEGRQLDVE